MGKKTKVGKQRKDKYYQLAKEAGYRSRAAYKLLQLNRKYEFLQRARVVVDLCAAPGGWLQVSQKNTPVASAIIGVDIVPIKPIRNVTTLVEDITSDRCRQLLRKELQTWKADVVLNDGAPNVGASWHHDAHEQAQLTLSALKLAAEFLHKGGWFVTKVFRSKDYHSLLWVFRQLFRKVFATKPQASRHESAEIFVVCQGYVAPDKIDPKFLDPKHVFAEVDLDPKKKLDIYHPEKQLRRKPEGYAAGDYTLYHRVNASTFVQSHRHMELLGDCSEIVMDDERIANHKFTTDEIKECCKDIKVLGRRELRLLLMWKRKLQRLFYEIPAIESSDSPKIEEEAGQIDKDVEEDDEIEKESEEIQKQLEELQQSQVQEAKRKKKKILKLRRKLQEKMNLQMELPNDRLTEEQDGTLFKLKTIKCKDQLSQIEEADVAIFDSDPSYSNLTLDRLQLMRRPKYMRYPVDQPIPHDFKRKKGGDDGDSDLQSIGSMEEWQGQVVEDSGDEDTFSHVIAGERNPLLLDLDHDPKEVKKLRRTQEWFSKDAFQGLEDDEDDEDVELDDMESRYLERKDTRKDAGKPRGEGDAAVAGKKRKAEEIADDYVSDDSDSSDAVDEIGEAKLTIAQEKKKMKSLALGPVGLALGAMMATSKKMRRDIVDASWNRDAFNDENLPEWFVQDEKKHRRPNLPLTKELIMEYKARLKEINARPIKKVAEAKARNKRRTMNKYEKARKRAEGIVESVDSNDREKMLQVRAIYKRFGIGKKTKKDVTYVVSKKGFGGRRARRPAGVKGRYKMVDPRMRKDDKQRKLENKSSKNTKGSVKRKLQKRNKK